MSKLIPNLNEKVLRELYVDQKWSTIKIAQHFNCNDESVRKRMRRYDIPMRSRAEAGRNKTLTPEHKQKLRDHLSTLHEYQVGENHPAYKTGKWIDKQGYVIVSVTGGRMKEHRYVVEQHLERKLEPWEHVHHVDGNKQNNHISNLEVLAASAHLRLEWLHLERRKNMSIKMKQIRAEKYWSSRSKKKVD